MSVIEVKGAVPRSRSVPWWGATLFWGAAGVLLWMSGQQLSGGIRELESFRMNTPAVLSPAAAPTVVLESNPLLSPQKTRPVTFRLLAPAAQNVYIGGTFNNFDATQHPLKQNADGVWETTLQLPLGPCLYKFKVDGQWELDPTNPEKTPAPREASLLDVAP